MKLSKITLYLISLLVFFHVTKSMGQGISNLPAPPSSIVPPSPTAAALGKYGDIPVSLYTGIPDISIPLYTIESKGLKLPISLSYHASGIKVEEEASWVGLGWSVFSGGVITRSVRGLDDLPLGNTRPGYPDYIFPVTINNNNYVPGSYSADMNFFKSLHNNTIDGEPDVFYFNFFGHSGRFYIQQRPSKNHDYTFHVESKEKILIQLIPPGNHGNNWKWIFTTADGTKYFFGTEEKTKYYIGSTLNFAGPPTLNNYPEDDDPKTMVSSWYLDKIVAQDGNEVNFYYTAPFAGLYPERGTRRTMSYSENRRHLLETIVHFQSPGCFPSMEGEGHLHRYYMSLSVVQDIYLKEIVFRNGKIKFETSDREDLQSESVNIKAQKLDEIAVYRTVGGEDHLLKSYAFGYSYFTNSDPNRNYSIGSYQYQYENTYSGKRLKLVYVQERKGSVSIPPYEFEYIPTNYPYGDIPDKYSTSRDHWGYFNNKPNNLISDHRAISGLVSTLIPSVIDSVNDEYYSGGDRNPDSEFMQIGTLKQIKYPTGGTTTFEYESNDYSESSEPLLVKQGGGIRILRTIDHEGNDPANDVVKKYLYTYDDNGVEKSSGLQMAPLNYEYIYPMVFVKDCSGGLGINYKHYTNLYLNRSSESNVPLGSSAQGSHIGYTSATVLYGENGENGKTVYEYRNSEELIPYFPNIPNVRRPDNGLLKSQIEYKNSEGVFTKVTEKTITYKKVAATTVKGVKCKGCEYIHNAQLAGVNYIPLIKFYDNVSEWWHPETETMTVFDADDESKNVTTVTQYFYENPNHYQLTKMVQTQSDGSELVTEYTYPLDYVSVGTGTIAAMKHDDKHMHSSVIEKVVKRREGQQEKTVAAEFTDYKSHRGIEANTSSVILPARVLTLDLVSPKSGFVSSLSSGAAADPDYSEKIQYKYTDDGLANIAEIRGADGTPTSYLWGHEGAYPIAEVKNARIEDIFYSSFEDGNGVDINDAKMGRKSVRYGYLDDLMGLSNGPYVQSYWKKTGQDWEEVIDDSIQISENYHEFNITAEFVDELRFHPRWAYMSTYAYDPLTGMTAKADASGTITYYEYENLQRLEYIRDKDKNISTKIVYNYDNHESGPDPSDVDTAAMWVETGTYRCIKKPASNHNTGEQEKYYVDINVNSATYNTGKWMYAGISTGCPVVTKIYAKLSMVNPHVEQNSYYYGFSAEVRVTFYIDRQCTKPYRIDRPVTVKAQVTFEDVDEQNYYHWTEPRQVYVPTGNEYYSLGREYFNEHFYSSYRNIYVMNYELLTTAEYEANNDELLY